MSLKNRIIGLLVTAVLSIGFVGCGGGGGGSSAPAGGGGSSTATTTINGQATLGPLSGSDIILMDLNNTIIASSTAKSDNTDLDNAGAFSFSVATSKLPDTLLLVAGGGKDIDPLDDGAMNNNVDNNGSVHAIVTLSDLQLKGIKINPLTEVIYQDAINTYGSNLASLSKNDLKTFLNKEAKIYLTDANATYSDILTFNPRTDKAKSKINWNKVLSLVVSGIHRGESSGTINERVTSLKSWLKSEGVYTSDDNTSIEQIKSDGNGNRVVTSVTKADDNSSIGTIKQVLTTDTGEVINIYASKVNDTESYLRASIQKQGHTFSIEGKTTLLQGLSFDTNTISNFVGSLIEVTDTNATSIQITIDKQLTNKISDHEVVLKIDGREPTAEEMQILQDDPVVLWNTESTKIIANNFAKYKFTKNGQNFTLYVEHGTGVVYLEIDMQYYKQMMGIIDYSNGVSLNNIKNTALTLLGVIGDDAILSAAQQVNTAIGVAAFSKVFGLASIVTDLHFIATGGVSRAAIKLGAAHTVTYLLSTQNTETIYENKPYYPIIFYKPQNLKSKTIYLNILEYQYPALDQTNLTSPSTNMSYREKTKSLPLCKITPKANKAYVILPGEIVLQKELKDYPIYDVLGKYIGKAISRIELSADNGFLSGIIEQSNTYKILDAQTIYTNFTYSTANNQLILDATSSIAPDGSITDYIWKNALGTTIATGRKPTISFDKLIVNNGLASVTLETKSAGYTGTKTKMISLCGANEVYQYNACVRTKDQINENFSTDLSKWSIMNYDDYPGSVNIKNGMLKVYRNGAGGNGGSVGISAATNINITNSTNLSFDVITTSRTVGDGCGWTCEEYPVNVQLQLENSSGYTYILRYAANYGGAEQNKTKAALSSPQYGTYDFKQIATDIPKNTLRHLSFNIKAAFPDATKIKNVYIFGSGWDFEGYIDNVKISK